MTAIHPTALVHEGARLGEAVHVGAYCVIGPKVRIGDRVRLQSHVVVEGDTAIGHDCDIHAFACLGGTAQMAGAKDADTRLEIGPRNIIREHVTMHAGSALHRGVTTVGSDGMYMVGSHVAHDCIVGDGVIMANNASLAGHVQIGDFVTLGGLVGVHQHTRVGRYAFVGALAMVTKDVIPFGSVWGNHAHLEGLNLVGLKRRGFSREVINELRAAYRQLFADEGTFQERLEEATSVYAGSAEVMELIDFIRADANRPLCLPGL